MNPYVGTAKSAPDSRIPRRFSAASSTIRRHAHSASWCCMNGSADFAFCTPDETDTATVST